MYFWQDYIPQSILFSIGPLTIRWYGLILVLAMLIAAFYAGRQIVKRQILSQGQYEDLVFYLIIFSLIGARFGHVVFFNLAYYLQQPLDVFKVWQGGLSIQGAILAALITLYVWAKKKNVSFWQLGDALVPALALGQAIGRWGNYFNQELFGKPSSSWLSIPIEAVNRPAAYYSNIYFLPAFLFESILNFILFICLHYIYKKNKLKKGMLLFIYLASYSVIRFFMEFIRIDETIVVGQWRLPQIISIFVFLLSIIAIYLLSSLALPKSKK